MKLPVIMLLVVVQYNLLASRISIMSSICLLPVLASFRLSVWRPILWRYSYFFVLQPTCMLGTV